MAIQKLQIESILDGMSQTQYFGGNDSYNSAIGIDPDFPVGTDTKASGIVFPTRYEKFSGTELDGYPLWIITNTKTSNSYVYTSTGKLHSFDISLAMRATDEAATSLPISITGGEGNGAAYYNNYVYLAETADITRYGPLSGGTVAKTENAWTGGTFSKTALTDTTYPTIRGAEIPNHPMHVHTDNSLYIGDVVSGQGVIHRLRTKKVTVEGDTDDTVVPSAFNALDLPFGFYPTDMESYGTDLVIATIQSTGTTINQGKATLFFWDPTNTDTFYRQVSIPDPLVTALLNVNGVLIIFSGNGSSGMRISQYIGGETVSDIAYIEDGSSPLAGAVDALGARLVWSSFTTYPAASASVYAYGSKNSGLPKGLHNIIRATATGSNPIATAIRYVQQASSIRPRLIVGWGDGSGKGLDKLSTTAAFNAVWRSKFFNINRHFTIKKLILPLAGVVDATTTITAKLYIDDASKTITLQEINNTNYSGKRKAVFKADDLRHTDGTTADGETNFFLELTFTGTTEIPVLLPIDIEVDISDEN